MTVQPLFSDVFLLLFRLKRINPRSYIDYSIRKSVKVMQGQYYQQTAVFSRNT
jgi:hypothetical protein